MFSLWVVKLLGYLSLQENFVSKVGKSKHQLWHELCELIAKNPEKVIPYGSKFPWS